MTPNHESKRLIEFQKQVGELTAMKEGKFEDMMVERSGLLTLEAPNDGDKKRLREIQLFVDRLVETNDELNRLSREATGHDIDFEVLLKVNAMVRRARKALSPQRSKIDQRQTKLRHTASLMADTYFSNGD